MAHAASCGAKSGRVQWRASATGLSVSTHGLSVESLQRCSRCFDELRRFRAPGYSYRPAACDARHPSIDHDILPSEKPRPVADEKNRRLGDVVRKPRSRYRLDRGEALLITPVTRSALEPSRPAFFPKIPVTIAPGEMQFTRMAVSPNSAAVERVSACTAPFEAL